VKERARQYQAKLREQRQQARLEMVAWCVDLLIIFVARVKKNWNALDKPYKEYMLIV
jgi:hypothetical protein